jgi:hypothetical protein
MSKVSKGRAFIIERTVLALHDDAILEVGAEAHMNTTTAYMARTRPRER